jgi:hypothetical protein
MRHLINIIISVTYLLCSKRFSIAFTNFSFSQSIAFREQRAVTTIGVWKGSPDHGAAVSDCTISFKEI